MKFLAFGGWLLSTVFFSLSANAEEDVHVEHITSVYGNSLDMPYIDEELNNKYWNWGGDAIVDINREVRLTQDRQSKQGWLWSKIPLSASSWIVEFEFKVHGDSPLAGDGFAFWYTQLREVEGPVFGSVDKFTGLGVFFDTYANSRPKHLFPYISVMLGDGKTIYSHQDDGQPNEIGGCTADFRAKEWPTKAKVKYVENGYLQIQTNFRGNDEWEDCVIIPHIELPKLGYIGFSAATGDVSDNHDIIQVKTVGIVNPDKKRFGDPPKKNDKTNKKRPSLAGEGGTTVLGFFLWILAAIGILVIAYVAYFIYLQMSAKSYKRF
ncbi:hypothetical protein HK098_000368 [Nowakowskiella sp. JEL0407]|nr:hypothetical protein HK098_000368 [Nowakowskiella sp. JEL0407]